MKQITLSDTREKLKKGIDTLADVVKVTLGGKGKNVIINNGFENVKIINDGVTIAREVELDDEVENTGAILAKQAAEKTNDEAGDATTTTIVLLQAFLNEMMNIKTKDVRGLREQIDKNIKVVLKYLDENKKELGEGDVYRIAKNSSLDEDIAKTVEKIMAKIGKDGLVSIEDGQKPGITSEVVLGIKIDDGYLSPYMITDPETMKSTLKDNVPVLITKKRITNMKEILPLVENLQSQGKNEMLVLVDDIPDDVLALMVVNKIKGNFNFCVVRTRNMEDIATVTGAEIVSDESGGKFTAEVLGYADKIETGKYFCQVSGGKEDQETVNAKIEELKKVRENADNEYDKQVASQRIARLQGGVSLIKIAGDNEQQTKEKKLKLEDALNSVKSSMDEGIIEGGGMALYRASEKLEFVVRATMVEGEKESEVEIVDMIENQAASLVFKVIKTPFEQILKNADEDVEKISSAKNLDQGMGYNVVTRKYENFYESGIIDPVKAVKRALINAFAMGTSIMTAEAGVIVIKEKNGAK